MSDSRLHNKTEQYVTMLFEESTKEGLDFHNLEHTKYVVDKAKEIAGHYQLNGQEGLILFIASWFHDTGYLFSMPDVHEERSVEIMRLFLKEEGEEDLLINAVADCIMATRFPTAPEGILQQIICDADTYNFGTKEFKHTNKLVFNELNHLKNDQLEKGSFNAHTYKMLEQHKYYTDYCNELLQEGKLENMKKIEKKLHSNAQKEKERKINLYPVISEKDGTPKGMQTMLRLTSSNHVSLSEMADKKANILISVNGIIISLLLSILLRKLQTDPYLTIPTILFLFFSVTTIVIAIIATRPKISAGTFAAEDIVNKKTNLLFFGNFYRMDLETYDKAMRTMMRDSDYLYSSIIKDIYYLGLVLGRKYKLLRLAYNIFMIGIIISVCAFAIASVINAETPVEAVSHINNAGGSPF